MINTSSTYNVFSMYSLHSLYNNTRVTCCLHSRAIRRLVLLFFFVFSSTVFKLKEVLFCHADLFGPHMILESGFVKLPVNELNPLMMAIQEAQLFGYVF